MTTNNEIAQHLLDVGYLLEQSKDRWRANAYYKAAEIVKHASPLTFKLGTLQDSFAGIGASTKATIEEFAKSNTSSKYIELLAKGLPPPSIRELQRIPKVGIVTAKKLWEQFNITTLKQFEENLDKIKGTEFEKYIVGFHKIKNTSERLPAAMVKEYTDRYVDALISAGMDVGYAGSMRRGRETLRDVDVIVCLQSEEQKIQIRSILAGFGLTPDVRDGDSKWGLSVPVDGQSVTLDLNFCTSENRGSYYLYLTGDKHFNVEMRTYAKEHGWLINEHGFYKNGIRMGGEKEEDIFNLLGIEYTPPECREHGIMERLLAGKAGLTKLINHDSIIIDLHSHSVNSDGGATWEQMFKAAQQQGLKVLGITDHSKGSGFGPEQTKMNNLITDFDAVRTSFPIRALYGSEVDVKTNLELDYDNSVLNRMDYFLIATHHSPDKNLTERYLHAMKAIPDKPKIIAHPRNVKVGTKEPSEADWDLIFKTCKETNTIVELNGQPERSDSEFATMAMKAGVYIAINSDCHGINFRRLLDIGVKSARRGGVTTDRVVNTSKELLDRWLQGKLYE